MQQITVINAAELIEQINSQGKTINEQGQVIGEMMRLIKGLIVSVMTLQQDALANESDDASLALAMYAGAMMQRVATMETQD